MLVLFLRELGDILGGESGADAVDPSGPPLNINFVVDNGEKEDKLDSKEQAPVQQDEDEDEDEDGDKLPLEDEDTSPPIKVNESQDTRLIRQKIRKLMRS